MQNGPLDHSLTTVAPLPMTVAGQRLLEPDNTSSASANSGICQCGSSCRCPISRDPEPEPCFGFSKDLPNIKCRSKEEYALGMLAFMLIPTIGPAAYATAKLVTAWKESTLNFLLRLFMEATLSALACAAIIVTAKDALVEDSTEVSTSKALVLLAIWGTSVGAALGALASSFITCNSSSNSSMRFFTQAEKNLPPTAELSSRPLSAYKAPELL